MRCVRGFWVGRPSVGGAVGAGAVRAGLARRPRPPPPSRVAADADKNCVIFPSARGRLARAAATPADTHLCPEACAGEGAAGRWAFARGCVWLRAFVRRAFVRSCVRGLPTRQGRETLPAPPVAARVMALPRASARVAMSHQSPDQVGAWSFRGCTTTTSQRYPFTWGTSTQPPSHANTC